MSEFNYHLNKTIPYSARRAFKLMNRGVWMSQSRGYYHKNDGKYGYYFGEGDYPGCVRACQKHTLDDIKSKGNRWYRVVIE